MTNRNYYKVEAKCGHVGRGRCIYITFATTAENAKEAAAKVRDFKRVKHDHKDAIREVTKITYEEFIALRAQNDADPYLHCKNVQEQRKLENFEERVVEDRRETREKTKRSQRLHLREVLRIAESGLALKKYLIGGEAV